PDISEETVNEKLTADEMFSPFSKESIRRHWEHTVYREGHPSGYTLVIAGGKMLAGRLPVDFSPKTRYRLGPILLFSLAAMLVFYRLTRLFGYATAVFSVICILLIPRLFAHLQIAGGDSVLISAWLLVWGLFPSGLTGIWGSILTGMALGLLFSAKFSGLVAVLPLSVYLLYIGVRCRRANDRVFIRRLPGLCLAIGLTALLTFYLLNPAIWQDPFQGIRTYFYLNTHREHFNIATCFLGHLYNLDHPLPWYNTLFLTVITVPVGLLFLAMIPVIRLIRTDTRKDRASSMKQPVEFENPAGNGNPAENNTPEENVNLAGNERLVLNFLDSFENSIIFLLLNFIALLIVRAFPGLPVHDGIRLFIPSFAFLGIIAGIGAGICWRRWFGRFAVLILLAASVLNLYWYSPQWLSGYNLLIGGLQGATQAGMEPTYYWDSLDTEVLDWLNQNTDADGVRTGKPEAVLFASFSSKTIRRYRQWGDLLPEARTISAFRSLRASDPYRWYVVQNRPSGWSFLDIELKKNAKPVYRKTIQPRWGTPRSIDSVTLLEVYDYRDLIQTARKLKKSSSVTTLLEHRPDR
ncbi:MAG: hypothetical protein IKW74_01925, partial [Thermoguttaceae bacterium]|nr:hypothetical protein [Thermoguttaceae bacterium]